MKKNCIEINSTFPLVNHQASRHGRFILGETNPWYPLRKTPGACVFIYSNIL